MSRSLERDYQRGLIKRIKNEFPDAMVLKNDPTYIQGIPDLTVFHENRWATLEVKKSSKETPAPNQEHYVERMNGMSYSAFVNPDNESEVMDDLRKLFRPE